MFGLRRLCSRRVLSGSSRHGAMNFHIVTLIEQILYKSQFKKLLTPKIQKTEIPIKPYIFQKKHLYIHLCFPLVIYNYITAKLHLNIPSLQYKFMMQSNLSEKERENSHIQALEQQTRESDELAPHRKYGRMVVLYKSERMLITLGPDYGCLICAIIVFAGLFTGTNIKIFNLEDQTALKYCALMGAIFQLLIYLSLALSNPGIYTQEDSERQQNSESSKKRFCRKCQIYMKSRMRHCVHCQVCIRGYDHHCPWTSKCIGQDNLFLFKIFVIYTPLYILICIALLLIDFS